MTHSDDQRDTVAANLGLIAWVLQRSRVPDDRWDDAFQDGVFGLATAARKFDPSRGVKFSTYAVNWIRQAVQRGYGVEQGVNVRRVMFYGGDMPPRPVSLDVPQDEDGRGSPVPVADDDPECDAVEAAAFAETWRRLRAVCRDRIDEAIVDAAAAAALRSEPWSPTRTAALLGVNKMTVTRRRARIVEAAA